MKFYDISMPLHGDMVTWANESKFKRREEQAGDAIVSALSMSTHMGTHIDAPKHFLGRRARSVDRIDPAKLIGPCRVVEFDPSTSSGIKAVKGERILFKTRNSSRRLLQKSKFVTDYEAVDLPVAKYLAAKKIALLGVDYLGVEAKGGAPAAPTRRGEPRQGGGHPVHKALLRAGIVIVEGLDLSRVKPGKYNLAILPLRILGGDGAPARAVLWR